MSLNRITAFFFTLLTLGVCAQRIELKDIWSNGKYRSNGVTSPQSMRDGKHYTAIEFGTGGFAITRYDYQTGLPVDTLLETSQVSSEIRFSPIYDFTADERQILLYSEFSPRFRYSFESIAHVYNREQGDLIQVDERPVMHPTLDPTGNRVAFVQGNNLHLFDLASKNTTALTTEGAMNKIICGSSDWVYEEEFTLVRAYEWSPDGDAIAYLRFDEEEVPEFSMDVFGDRLYPYQERFKYPKAGEQNARVTAWISNPETAESTPIALEAYDYEYIPRIQWIDNNRLALLLVNRLQNHFTWVSVDVKSGEHEILTEETAPTYIEVRDPVLFNKDGSMIFQSERSGYNHLYRRDAKGRIKAITSGDWEVTEVYGMDTEGNIYFQSAQPTPMDRRLHRVSNRGKITHLSPAGGSYGAQFSASYKYFLRDYSDANTPARFEMCTSDGSVVRVIEDNAALRSVLAGDNTPEKTLIEVPITTEDGEEITLNGWMIRPPHFHPDSTYPLLMYVYGGPGSQTVTNQWGGSNQMWFAHLAQQGMVVASVDGRGTGARGASFRDCTYKTLGKLESHDQIAAARYFGNLPYIETDQISIFGWSYGGYMSSLCLSLGADVFHSAIAVAPVTNWRYYDSIYTERYMALPGENGDGYDAHSPISHTDKIVGDLLLVHGSADDNVHYQNSMEYVRRLIQSDVDFEFMTYPDKNHGIYGGNTRLHLYRKMSNFLLEK